MLQPLRQAAPFAAVLSVIDDLDRQSRQRGNGAIGRAVIDDQDLIDMRERTFDDSPDSFFLVMSRDQHGTGASGRSVCRYQRTASYSEKQPSITRCVTFRNPASRMIVATSSRPVICSIVSQ